jgi:hypothetical protein
MKFLIISIVLVFLESIDAFAQNTIRNQWFLQADVGFAPIGNNDFDYVSEMVVTNDSIRSFKTSNSIPGSSFLAIPINVSAIYKKKSGWHYVLGLNGFVATDVNYMRIDEQQANQYIAEYGGYPTFNLTNTSYQQNILAIKTGIGYETSQLRHADIFANINLLIGGGWATELSGSGPELYNYEYLRWHYGNTLLKTFGATLDVGSSLKLSKSWAAVLKGGFTYLSMNSNSISGKTSSSSYFSNHTPDIFRWPETPATARGNSVGGIYGFAIHLGIRYKL